MQQTPRSRKWKWLFWLLVVPALLFAVYLWFIITWSYSQGERAGYIQKFSKRGWLCKTWEGELALITMPGTVAEKFLFTVRDEDVARRVNATMGQRVTLDYAQHIGIPTSCFGDSQYFVTDVRVVPEPSLLPSAPPVNSAPPAAPAALTPAPAVPAQEGGGAPARGLAVCVNFARNREAAQAVVAGIVATGGRAIAVQADVADRDEARRLFETVDRELGMVTALVNNAGIAGALKPAEDLARADLDPVFGVNVMSLFWCCGEAIRRMARKHGGRGGAIVNVGSIASRYGGMPGMVAYAASKGAVDSFTVALAKEIGHEGIRVNGLRPGTTRTDILEPLGGDALMARVAASTPLGRVGDPDEIAEAALWLLSDQASFTHGAILDVSGGR